MSDKLVITGEDLEGLAQLWRHGEMTVKFQDGKFTHVTNPKQGLNPTGVKQVLAAK